MSTLVAGLILFLGVHSVRIFAEPWRVRTIARIGENRWKGVYSLISIAAFVLLVWGYGQARQQGVVLSEPPVFMRHMTSLLMLVSFVLL
ncbi:MAG: NnrU family protein, partial [Burkholderiales bacterium]